MTPVNMKAIETKKYGSAEVFQLNEVVKPSPKPNEVLIRNYATTVTAADVMMRKGKPMIGRLYLGLLKPKMAIQGFEFAGEVVETGEAVTLFKSGDRVFGGTTALGGYAEYLCVNEQEVLITMPDNISYSDAAPVTGSAITALHFLKGKAAIKNKQKVLINGASGAVGTYAVQIAKNFGAEVTGVCSTVNCELVRALGAHNVIDYTKDDFTKNGIKYDIIFDAVGKNSYSNCKNSLSENGIYLSAVLDFSLLIQMIRTSVTGNKKAKFSATGMLAPEIRLGYLKEIKELLKTGKIKSVIDSRHPLSQVGMAHNYVEKGHKKGNVIITMHD